MVLCELVGSEQAQSCAVFGPYKVTKLQGPCDMYVNHARDSNDAIVVDSIRADSLNHTKDYNAIHLPNLTQEQKLERVRYIENYIKTTILLDDPRCCRDYTQLTVPSPCSTQEMSRPVFYCNYTDVTWTHTIMYFYPQVHIYLELRKYLADIVFIMPAPKNSGMENYILDLIGAEHRMTVPYGHRVRNSGPSFFAGAWSLKFSSDIIDGFFRDIVVKQTLLRHPTDVSSYPKKLLFLRNSQNSVGRIVSNRQQIVAVCAKYGYVDVDQTRFSIDKVIHLVNNATHLVQEAGGSSTHLLWAGDIRSVTLHYSTNEYYHSYVANIEDADPFLRVVGDNGLSDIAYAKNSTIVFNDLEYVRTGKPSLADPLTFTRLDALEDAIKKNEHSE